jgi:uncharacterized membrane protein YgdD (TMEM256/DUF423 family)
MKQRTALIVASLFGVIAVGLGAFGAHALKATLQETGRLETYELAVRYQFFHTLALLATACLMEKLPSLKIATLLFSVGIFIFSGSLFVLALTNQSYWGAITPIGGLSLMGGWLSLGWAVYRDKNKKG